MKIITLHDNETMQPIYVDAHRVCILDVTGDRGTPVHMSFVTPEPTHMVRETQSEVLHLMGTGTKMPDFSRLTGKRAVRRP